MRREPGQAFQSVGAAVREQIVDGEIAKLRAGAQRPSEDAWDWRALLRRRHVGSTIISLGFMLIVFLARSVTPAAWVLLPALIGVCLAAGIGPRR